MPVPSETFVARGRQNARASKWPNEECQYDRQKRKKRSDCPFACSFGKHEPAWQKISKPCVAGTKVICDVFFTSAEEVR